MIELYYNDKCHTFDCLQDMTFDYPSEVFSGWFHRMVYGFIETNESKLAVIEEAVPLCETRMTHEGCYLAIVRCTFLPDYGYQFRCIAAVIAAELEVKDE